MSENASRGMPTPIPITFIENTARELTTPSFVVAAHVEAAEDLTPL